MPAPPVTVVMITYNRREGVLATLPRLLALPERPPVIVVDNDSADGTAPAVRAQHPDVDVVALDHNAGAAGRNVGVERAHSPYVAFADDDSWWVPGALTRAAAILDAHPDVAVVAAQVLVGSARRPDPACLEMARSPLPSTGLPGPSVLGFIACGAVVRRDAFIDVGGFDELMQVGGEEHLLAVDLAAAGWRLCYCADVVAIHEPSPARDRTARERIVIRNRLWHAWLRRRFASAARCTAHVTLEATHDQRARAALLEAMRSAPAVVARRHPIPRALERQLRTLDRVTTAT